MQGNGRKRAFFLRFLARGCDFAKSEIAKSYLKTLRFEPKVTDRAFAVGEAGANIKAKEVTLKFEVYDYNNI